MLEHVDDVESLARSVFRILKPGGYFLATGHNYRAWTTKLLGRRSPIFDLEHLQLFSPASLEYLYKTGGFTEVDVDSMANNLSAFILVKT